MEGVPRITRDPAGRGRGRPPLLGRLPLTFLAGMQFENGVNYNSEWIEASSSLQDPGIQHLTSNLTNAEDHLQPVVAVTLLIRCYRGRLCI